MINTTNIMIPKEYRKYIHEVYREDLDDSKAPDGATYWLNLKECCKLHGIHLLPYDFKEDLLNDLKNIRVIASVQEYIFSFGDYGHGVDEYKKDFSRLNAINTKSLKKFLSNINENDIDLENKMENLYESGILNPNYNSIPKTIMANMETYIKENAIVYAGDIQELTEECYYYDCCEYNEWSAGLYNCDELYLKAINKECPQIINAY